MPKDIRYLNRDFGSIQDQLINFAEAYYPNTFRDFSEGSVGLMYIDMASYVGDVLSFYTDVKFKESFIQFAEENKNVVSLAKQLGYRPNVTNPATTTLNVFAAVPARQYDRVKPDFRFVPIIEENMIVASSSNSGVEFRTVEDINFEVDTPDNPLKVDILEKDEQGLPSKYLLTKEVQAVAGTIESTTFNFSKPSPYPTRVIEDQNVIEILNVQDAQGNEWKEVPYLAQDRVFEDYRNIDELDQEFSEFRKKVPFLLNVEKTSKRFVTRTQTDERTYLQFGSGSPSNEENVVPEPLTVGNPETSDVGDLSLDPSNFLSANTYGEIPFQTTLEVEYVSGGGVNSNVSIDDLTEIVNLNFNIENIDIAGSDENEQILQNIKNSIRVTNPVPATGGGPGESTDEIRKNAQAFFAAQNRAVTKEDYVTRVLSMPSKYGSVAKAMVKNENDDNVINLHVLGWNGKKHLVPVNDAIKNNIKTYIKKYRMLTDDLTILNGHVINLSVDVEISIMRSSSKRKAKISVIDKLEELLSPENRQFNQPIIKGEIINDLNSLDLVQNIRKISFENKVDSEEGYSGNRYDLKYAERQGVVYPSKDPSVFTVRYPNKDIEVKVV